jgi:hypothetical protein
MPVSVAELRQTLERLRLAAAEFKSPSDLVTDRSTKGMLDTTTANLIMLADQLEQFIRSIELLL